MVDKKLSEFSQITPSEISKLICLFLDQNNAIKNGVVDFAALDALLLHKAGTETITGNKTFSGDTVFAGDSTFNTNINANINGSSASCRGNSETANKSTTKQNSDSSVNIATTEYVHNILNAIYPVGSLYIGTQSTCPMSTLISGSTWEIVATDRALWGGNGSNGNTTIAAGLPNIDGTFSADTGSAIQTGAFSITRSIADGRNSDRGTDREYSFRASRSSSVFGNSNTVQPPAYVVNVWRRTA